MRITVETQSHGKFISETAEDFTTFDGELVLVNNSGAKMATFADGEWVYVYKSSEVLV